MKTIKMTEKQIDLIIDLIKVNAEKINSQGQGNCTLHNDLYDEVKSIFPDLTSLSANYYDADGNSVFALKVMPSFFYDGDTFLGFVTACPRGHLSKYYKTRIKTTN